jgi:hypothetical protein
MSLECRVENTGKEPTAETVLELPFLCSGASLDGSEASRFFGERVFREDAHPPAPFTIGVVGAGRSRSATFIPLTKAVPSAAWCNPSSYLLRAGRRQGAVEITGCETLKSP